MVTRDFIYFKLEVYQLKRIVSSSFVDQIFLDMMILWHSKYGQALKHLYRSIYLNIIAVTNPLFT